MLLLVTLWYIIFFLQFKVTGTCGTIKCAVVCIYDYVPDVTFNLLSSFYNTLEDTSWNKSSLIRVDGNRVRLVYHFLLRFLTVLHMKSFSEGKGCSIYWSFFKNAKKEGRKFNTTRVLSKLFDTISKDLFIKNWTRIVVKLLLFWFNFLWISL